MLHTQHIDGLLLHHAALKSQGHGIRIRGHLAVNALQHIHHGGILGQIGLHGREHPAVQVLGHSLIGQLQAVLFQIILDHGGTVILDVMNP